MQPWALEHELLGLPVGLVPPILLAIVLGAAVGLERELSGHPAGLRTHILVALGATLVTLISVWLPLLAGNGDPGRIASQVVVGVGFLGAGAILREGAGVRGLTTAASIWMTAMLGIAVGVSPRTAVLAVFATVLVIGVLWGLHLAADWMEAKGMKRRSWELRVSVDAAAVPSVVCSLMEGARSVDRLVVDRMHDAGRVLVRARLRPTANRVAATLAGNVSQIEGVHRVEWDE